jgi:hypothetical protein
MVEKMNVSEMISILIKLLEEQEGVKITYHVETAGEKKIVSEEEQKES